LKPIAKFMFDCTLTDVNLCLTAH